MQFGQGNPSERDTDLFQNIDLAILSTAAHAEDMSDYTVRDALDALVRAYNFEVKGKKEYRPPKLTGLERELYANLRQMCEWRLGRVRLEELSFLHDHGSPARDGDAVATVEQILRCLRIVQRTRETQTAARGRRGYLDWLNGADSHDHHDHDHDHGHHDHGHHHHHH